MIDKEMVLPEDRDPRDLAQALASHRRIEIGQWAIHVDEHGAWLTNPYGLDCALFQAVGQESAEKICAYIKDADAISHEWGTL